MVDTPDEKVVVDVEADASQVAAAAQKTKAEFESFLATLGKVETQINRMFGSKLPGQLKQLQSVIASVQNLQGPAAELARPARQATANVGLGGQLRGQLRQQILATIKDSGLAQELSINKELAKAQGNRLDLYRRIRAAGQGDTLFTSQAYVEYLRQLGDVPKKGSAAFKQWTKETAQELADFNKRIAVEEAAQAQKQAADRIARTQSTLRQERTLQEQHRRDLDRLFKKDLGAIMSGGTPDERAALAKSSVQNLRDYAGRRGLTGFDASRLTGVYDDAESARQIRESIRQRAVEDRELERRQRIELRERERRQSRRSPEGIAGRLSARAELAVDYSAMGLAAYTVGSSIRNAVELQKALKQLQAISGATSGEMKILQQTVFDVGNTTNFTNAQVAETATVLAQAGFSARQIKEALPAVAQLATATGASLEDAAQSVTSILTVFNMSADQTSSVSNKLASALNSSKLDFAQLSLGIQYAANTSADAGLSFEEMVAALGAMSNAGIKSGSTLGTGLRNVIESLENPSTKFIGYLAKMGVSAEDVDVKAVGLTAALRTLTEKGFSATDAIEAFGQRAGSAYAALVPNLTTLDAMQLAMLDSAAATEGAATQMDSFSAQATRAANATTQLVLVAGGPVLGAVQALMGGYADLTTTALKAAPALQLIFTVGASAAAAGTLVWLKSVATGLVGVQIQSLMAAAATGNLTAMLTAANVALGPIGWTVIGLTAAFTGLTYIIGGASNQLSNLQREVDAYKTKANEAQAESSKYSSRVEELTDFVERLTNQHARLSSQVGGAGREADMARRKFADWGLSLDGVGGNVDRLITKIVQLRGEMARAAAEQARLNLQNLQQERTSAEKLVGQRQSDLAATTSFVKNSPELSGRSKATIEAMQKGRASSADIEALRPELQRFVAKYPKNAMAKRMLDGLATLGTSQVAQIDAQIVAARGTVSTTTIQANPATGAAADRIKNYVNYYQNERARIAKIKDPTAKQAAYLQLQNWTKANMPKVEGILGEAANASLALPDVRGAGLNANQVRQTISDLVPGLAGLRMASRPADLGTNEKAVSGRLKAAQEEQKLAQAASKNRGLSAAQRAEAATQAATLQDEIKRLRRQKVLLQNQDEDPLVVESLLQSGDQEQDAAFARGGLPSGGGGGRRGDPGASQTAKTLGAQIKDLERQITIAAGRLSADQATTPEGRAGLVGMVDRRNALVRQQIEQEAKGSGANDAEVKSRLEAAQSEMDEFKRKILEGTVQDALDLLADLANRGAQDSTAAVQNTLRSGKGDLDLSLNVVEQTYSDALAADLAQIVQKYQVAPNERRQAQEEADAKAKNLKARIDAAIETVEAYVEGQTRAIERVLLAKQQELNARQGQLDRTSTVLDRFGVGGYFGGTFEKAQRGIKRDGVGAQMEQNRGLLGLAEIDIANYKSLLGQTSDPGSQKVLADKLKSAEDAAAGLRSELAASSLQYDELNRKAFTFSDLVKAAQQTVAYQRETGSGSFKVAFLEQLPDAFGKISTSFEDMLNKLVTNTGRAKFTIKDFAVSVLDTLKELAIKIATQKILLFVLSLFGGGGGGGEASFDMSALLANGSYQGGQVRRRAQGGPAARTIGSGNPNRDSVWSYTQPGEWILNRSAVSMIGEQELSALNSRGNRRFTEIGQAQSGGEPGSTVLNVWVVSPDQQASMGPNDVIAVISDNLMRGGSIKKLVKQVVVGAV